MRDRLVLAATIAASFALIHPSPARADQVQQCDAAYEQTQLARRAGKLLEARKQALICAAPACPATDRTSCTQWLAEIDALTPTVVFAAEDGAGADTFGVRVLVDGKPFADTLDGRAIAMDAGAHKARFEKAGAAPVEIDLLVREGEKARRVVATFPRAPALQTALALEPVQPVQPGNGHVPAWAWVSGGIGIALLGVGAGFGVSALHASSSLTSSCMPMPVSACTETSARDSLQSTRTTGRNAFIGLSVTGVVGVVVGVIGIATASRGAGAPPAAGIATLAPVTW